jgi:hypothetical protein
MVKISYILGQQVVTKEPAATTGQPLSLLFFFIRSGDIDGLERDERMGTGWRGRSICLTWLTWWARLTYLLLSLLMQDWTFV